MFAKGAQQIDKESLKAAMRELGAYPIAFLIHPGALSLRTFGLVTSSTNVLLQALSPPTRKLPP